MNQATRPRAGISLKTFLGRLIGLSLLPVLLLALWLAYDRVRDDRVQQDREAKQLARSIMSVIDQYLEVRIRALNMLAVSPLLDDPARRHDLYVQAQGFRESFDSHVILADVAEPMPMLFNTRVPFGDPLPPLPRPRGHAAAPTAVVTLKPAVGDSFIGPIANEPLVAIVVPALREGKAVFVLVTIFETRQLQTLLDDSVLPDGWAVSLRDGRGDLIARRVPPGFEADRVAPSGRFEVRSRVSPWSVVLEIPRPLQESQAITTAMTLGLGLLIATLAGVLIGSSGSRRLYSAVAALTPESADAPRPGIAEIAAARQRLDQAEARLRLWNDAFEKAQLNLAIGDPVKQEILAVNPAFARRRGYRPEEMAGLQIAVLFPADRLKTVLERVREADVKGHLVFETEHVARDGKRFPVLLDITVVHSPDDRPATRIVYALDMSARKAAETALRESERRYRELVQNANSAIIRYACDGTITFFNEYAQSFFGWSAEEVVGKHQVDILVPDQESTGADLRGLIADILIHPERYRNNINENICRDGRRVWMSWTNQALRDEQGLVREILTIGSDITERQRAEQEVRRLNADLEQRVTERTAELSEARERAETAARAKSEFLANMSHEIRTPMNAVLGLAYLLERLDLSQEAHELARKMRLAGRSLLGIINDILDFSKIESGHIEIEHAPFRLDAVLDSLTTLMTVAVGDKPLALIIRPPDGLDCTLLGDALRLGQVLINLTNNAIKFTDSGVVEIGVDRLARTDSQILVRFSVRDTGIGIDEATQARLFQPFVQADASTTRRFGGSGLGLVISQRLVELMGGRLELDSRPGEGSTFRFELRFEVLDDAPSRPAATARRPATNERRLAGLRLLVVDDSDINRDVAQRIFSDEGAEVHLTNDGREAVDWLLAHPDAVDIVLMDVQMPVMDGRAATRLIRETPGLAQLPVVALTADIVGNQQRAALEAGMDAFLSKPFDVTEAVTLILSLATPPADARHAADRAHEMPPAAPVAQPQNRNQGANLPGLAIDQGLRLWRDPDRYRQYLQRFARDYADSAQAIADADLETARQLAHKLKGTAGNMGLPEVAAQAGALEQQLAAGSAISVEALRDAMTTALESIARYAPDTAAVVVQPETRPETFTPPRTQKELALRLREALSAFERFDPPAAGPALDALAAHLSALQLAPLRQAVDEFNASAGTVAVRALAATLSIQMED